MHLDNRRVGTILSRILSYLWWPLLFAASLAITWIGVREDQAVLVFNFTYLGLALAIAALERAMPHESTWLENDGQIVPDIAHTVLNKGVAQVIVVVVTFMGIADWLAPHGGEFWPTSWPLALQTVLALLVIEFFLYWKHRLAHEWPPLWRFHAVHHSVTRLWFLNTGRFHLVDTLTGLAVAMPLLLLLGAPKDVLVLVSAITAIVGILTHANVQMECGWLNYIFNTPSLHRWHHSKVKEEGNTNYGENLVIFDQIFGTFYYPPGRPPSDIGIEHAMPETFTGQLRAPFTALPL